MGNVFCGNKNPEEGKTGWDGQIRNDSMDDGIRYDSMYDCDIGTRNDSMCGVARGGGDIKDTSDIVPGNSDSMYADNSMGGDDVKGDNSMSDNQVAGIGNTDHLNLAESKPVCTHVSDRGVNIQALRDLLKATSGKPVGEELVKKLIKPMTDKWKCSYADILPKEQRGRVNIFVSHAWRYPFNLLVSAVEEFERSNTTLKRPFTYFVDYCAINQHSPMADLENLKSCIQECQATVLVLSPWSDPIPLKRSWCIYEIMHTILSEKTQLEVVLPPKEAQKLRQSYLRSVDSVLAEIDSAKAEASVISDQEAIRSEIVDDLGGFVHVNNAVLNELRKWLDETVSQILDDWPVGDRKSQACGMFLNNAAIYFRRRALYGRAIPLSRELVKLEELKKEKPSRKMLMSKKNLATALRSLAKVRLQEGQKQDDVKDLLLEAKSIYEECIKLDDKYLHKNESLKPNLQGHSAELLEIMGDLENAEKLGRAAVEGYKSWADNQPNKVASYCTLAQILARREKFEEAEEFYAKGISGLKSALGVRHLWTLQAEFSFSCALLIRGLRDGKQNRESSAEGMEMMNVCRTGMIETLGKTHPYTRKCSELLEAIKKGSIDKELLLQHIGI